MTSTQAKYPHALEADALADWWSKAADLDYQITASFPMAEYEHFKLHKPENLIHFVEERLKDARYFGPYVIVVHDKLGKSLMHPHLLIKDNGRVSAVRKSFKRYRANVDKKDNGPIRGFECFLYAANRACERGADSRYWTFDPSYRRRPRPRGKGSAGKELVPATASSI